MSILTIIENQNYWNIYNCIISWFLMFGYCWVYTVVFIVYFQFCMLLFLLELAWASACIQLVSVHLKYKSDDIDERVVHPNIHNNITIAVSSIEYRVSSMSMSMRYCYEYSVWYISICICVCIMYSYNCSCISHSDWGRDSTTSVYLYCTSCTTYCTSLRRSLICTQPSAEACARITPSAWRGVDGRLLYFVIGAHGGAPLGLAAVKHAQVAVVCRRVQHRGHLREVG